MLSPAIATVRKMMESLPEPVQNQVVDHLREYLTDLQDEQMWDTLFEKTQDRLAAVAQRARSEIKAGQAQAMDFEQL